MRPLEQRVAQARVIVEACKDRVQQFRRTIDLGVADEREDRIVMPSLRQRRFGARRQVRAERQRRLSRSVSGRDAIDKIGVREHRGVLKHWGGCFRFVSGQREDESARRLTGPAHGFSQRSTHQDRRIVEQSGHRQDGFGAHGSGQIGVEKGAREHARALRPRVCVSGLRPG